MKRKSFIPLFICSLTTWLVGVSIMPLLPIYAGELGASSSSTGNFLAFSFAMLAAGTMLAGPLSRQLRHRRALIVLAGAAALPATWLMGRIDTVGQLTLLTSIVWFAAGIALTLQSILMGLLAARASRGRMFGLLASTTSLAGLIGGLFVGPMAESWGYQRLFALLALVWLVQIGAALLLPGIETPAKEESSPALPRPHGFSRSFWQLLLANMLVSTAASVGMMGGSIMMDRQGISLTAITLLAAFQAGMGLLTNPVAGRLSDRLSRKGVLMITYGSRAAGLLLLMVATSLAGGPACGGFPGHSPATGGGAGLRLNPTR